MAYFKETEVDKLKSLIGKTIRKVVYYHWDNLKSNDDYTSLDWIELIFTDQENVVIHHGEFSEGLELVSFDFETKKSELEGRFNGQISLARENATIDKFWLPSVVEKIKDVKLTEVNGQMSNHQIILRFSEDYEVEIVPDEEGMLVDFYEEI